MMAFSINAQVLLQGFYWDVPVDVENKKGTWYKHLESKLPYLQEIGVTGIWSPAPSKGNWGIYDMGYGIYDHYDLGDFDQIGTRSTRFGTRSDLKDFMNQAHQLGINVYADVVLNHMYSFQDKDLEANPAVKHYLLNRKQKHSGYPVNELRFGIQLEQNQTVQIKLANVIQKNAITGYRLKISNQSDMLNANSRFHPIKGKNNPYGYWEGVMESEATVAYQIHQNANQMLWLQLEVLNQDMAWSDQSNGLSIVSITDENGKEVDWKVYSYTGIQPESKKIQWSYNHFHPSSKKDYLLNYPDTGGIVANSKLFGHDFDHQSHYVRKHLINWGKWLLGDVGYDGARLDFVNGIDPLFVKDWTNEVIGDSLFCVTEFFTNSDKQIERWNKTVNTDNVATVKSFDFPLKKLLTDMCNSDEKEFDMQKLVDAGLISTLPQERIISFVENHDTGKEHDKWIVKDWNLAYSYILFHEPTPCLFYSHLFPTKQVDYHTKKDSVLVDSDLPELIETCLKLREILSGPSIGDSIYTSEHQYVAFRKGLQNYDGAILILNNRSNDAEKLRIDLRSFGLNQVDASFIDILHPETIVSVEDHFIHTTTPKRGVSLWMTLKDYQLLFKSNL